MGMGRRKRIKTIPECYRVPSYAYQSKQTHFRTLIGFTYQKMNQSRVSQRTRRQVIDRR